MSKRERGGGDDGKRGRGITTEIETVRKKEDRKKGAERENNLKEIESKRETEGNELTPPPLIHVHFPFNRFLA